MENKNKVEEKRREPRSVRREREDIEGKERRHSKSTRKVQRN